MANLMTAHNQWMNRPADQRFWDFRDAGEFARTLKSESKEYTIPKAAFRAEVGFDGSIGVRTETGYFPASHFAFNTLAQRGGAPAEYLRTLTPELAATCINHGLQSVPSDSVALVRSNGTQALRCVSSEKYGRVWYADTIETLQAATSGTNWRIPPGRPAVGDPREREATEEDCLRYAGYSGLSIKPGDLIAPSGIYLSDRDFFCLMVDDSKPLEIAGKPLYRFLMLANSEVKARVYSVTLGYIQAVCSNHILWGAGGVKELRVKHLGENWKVNYKALDGTAKFLLNSAPAADDERVLRLAASKELGTDDVRALDAVNDYVLRRRIGIPTKRLEEAQIIARTSPLYGGNPRTAYGFVSGLTEIARDLPYSDERDILNRQAAKIIDIVR